MATSFTTIRRMEEKTGWNTNSQLRLACEYIDGLVGGPEGFKRFLQEVAKDEAEEAKEDEG
jgi:hypothetical protein